MKLAKVQVQTFRSIVDSDTVDIEDGVTVIIGRNEQGKTNFLKAIETFNPGTEYEASDLPNHLRPLLEEKPPETLPIVTLWFALEPQDKKKLAPVLGELSAVAQLRCTKYYDDTYGFVLVKEDGSEGPLPFVRADLSEPVARIRAIVEDLKGKLEAHATRVPSFAANDEKISQIAGGLLESDLRDLSQLDNVVKTFATTMNGLTSQDQPILDDIAAALGDLDAARLAIHAASKTDPAEVLRAHLPSFILHDTKAHQIPNQVRVADFAKDAEGTSRGMANLCRAAGLTHQKIKDLAATADPARREAYEDYHKGTLSGGLNEFWTQAEYYVHFRIEKDQLSVSISDTLYTQRVPPSDRSDGFQWYLSFYASLLNELSTKTILLLDNPGLELHVDGQRDIKRFLEDKVGLTSQVLYVTHSPAMVDAFNLRQVRTVALLGNQTGTKVKGFAAPTGEQLDLLEPIRSAIGMSLVASLVFNQWNVLVEGAADKPIVEGVFLEHYKDLKGRVLVNGSLSERDAFLADFYHRTGLPYVILLDGDSGGRGLQKLLLASGIPEGRIVKLSDVFPERATDFAIEDILSAGFYHQAVKAAYPAQEVEQPPEGTRKRARLYEEAFKQTHDIGFNKRRVGEAVKRLLEKRAEDAETRGNLGKLSTAIVQVLQAPSVKPLSREVEAPKDVAK